MEKQHTFLNKLGQEIERVACNVYARISGYMRPVSMYNPGKKSEHYSRKYFKDTSQKSIDLRKRENAEFTSKYKDVNQQ